MAASLHLMFGQLPCLGLIIHGDCKYSQKNAGKLVVMVANTKVSIEMMVSG